MKTAITLLFVIAISALMAQPYAGKAIVQNGLAKSAGCTPPTTTTFMEMNNVRAMIHTAGNLWQVPGQNFSQYEVPKNSGVMALFTSALWLGGTDVNNQLKLAALRYRAGQDYWTGPLSEGAAETNYDNCAKYDRHFVTLQDDIREFDAWFSAGEYDAQNGTNTQNELFPGYEIPLIIQEWPAHGDISAGQDYYLAPFYDRNDDGVYNWTDGDYPWHDINKEKDCKVDRRVSLFGDLNYWWVMNDKGNIHTETGADPIGMEIRAQAFSFASNDEVNNMTFYNYELINRGTQTLFDTYFGCFTDGALGDPYDDYVGCDVGRGLAYYYNGDNYDADNSGYLGYKNNPPAVGVDFFEGPYQDNDGIDNQFGIGPDEALNGIGYGDTIVDNERFGMRRFLYYSNTTLGANPNQTDPINAADYYNYLRGFWKDGSPFYYGGSGHISDVEADPSVPCDFMFPGDTDPLGWGTGGIPQEPWTEQTAGNPPNDRRFVQSAGPFVLKPGAVNNITVGVVWARANSGDPFASVEALRRADDKAQALFENCFKVLEGPHAPDMQVQELENEIILTLTNPNNSNNAGENYVELDPFISAEDPSADRTYRFQGYQIYQLSGKDVSASDLNDVTKARLVGQCDLEDSIARIINFEFDAGLEASIPVERVNGSNEGIRHSFRVTEDLFAQGDKQLVNFKRYYYMAVAYAYNNFKTYNPTDPNALDGQQKLYLQSRKAASGQILVMEAVPHNPSPEADGTMQQIAYGSSPIITRIDGIGNGGRILELTEASKQAIINNGKLDTPSYDYGKGPINVKVVDPLNVASGYFTCKFVDYTPTTTNGADDASWIIYRYDQQGGNLIDSVASQRIISNKNEQIIPQWGISVHITQEKYFLPPDDAGSGPKLTTEFLEASIEFADSSKRWLSGVSDNDATFPTNWIRSGEYDPQDDPNLPGYECDPNVLDYLNPCSYRDEINADNDKVFADILEGTIAPHRLTASNIEFAPVAYYNYSGALTVKTSSSLSYMPSVDIVLTDNKDLWTYCPVFELGRDPALTVGGAEAGEMRKSPSKHKDGSDDLTSMGMGWFPGYAIDQESGVRLYMAFGENSFLGTEGGADMIWNPSDRLLDGVGTPLLGGVQPFYVYTYNNKTDNNHIQGYDFPAYIPSEAENLATNALYQLQLQVEANNQTAKRNLYGSLGWIAYPLAVQGQEINPQDFPTDVKIRIRVGKEYKNYTATGENNGQPMYGWSMDDISTVTGSQDQLAEALKLINVVPNPYLAYSQYERNRLDTRVKITNLPERCTVRIYSTQGKLIKTLKKDSPITWLDWRLVNEQQIPVASGVYLIHVEVPGIGERIIKSYVSIRAKDLQNL